MTVRLVLAVTDGDWFNTLRLANPDEVNFWSPSPRVFQALVPGELFLFKLHAPRNFVVGGGVFAHADEMPCSLAWESFGLKNGARSLLEMRNRIAKYRSVSPQEREDFRIGSRILTQPFFFDEPDWIPVPADWSPNIVSFKTYTTANITDRQLWEQIQRRLVITGSSVQQESLRYGEPYLIRPRLGQGAFRALVTNIYGRRCAITGEKTLPALDAVHIRPFGEGGEREAQNGILLRRDLHSLFDGGYVTVDEAFRFNVSSKIKEEFENGKDYYALDGKELFVPLRPDQRPEPAFLRWHNETRYLG